jgi:hypothetical protein
MRVPGLAPESLNVTTARAGGQKWSHAHCARRFLGKPYANRACPVASPASRDPEQPQHGGRACRSDHHYHERKSTPGQYRSYAHPRWPGPAREHAAARLANRTFPAA